MFKRFLGHLKSFIDDEQGQTSVEYILLIGMVAIISLSLFKNLEEYLLSNPDSLINRYLDEMRLSFGQNRYKYFTLRR